MVVIIGLLSLGIVTLIHELGHFLCAKYFNVQVDEFAIGIGPKILSKTWRNTLWSIRILPLGGFCRMKTPLIDDTHDKRLPVPKTEGTLESAPFHAKAIIILGGPCANFILFAALSLLLFIGGNRTLDISAIISPIMNPALSSSLQEGDIITKIGDHTIHSYSDIVGVVGTLKGKKVNIAYTRGETNNTTSLILNDTAPALGVAPYIVPVITSLKSSSRAFQLGLRNGDRIVSVQGKATSNALSVLQNTGNMVVLVIERQGEEQKYEFSPQDPQNILEEIGISFPFVSTLKWDSFGAFVTEKVQMLSTVIKGTTLFFVDLLKVNTKEIQENVAGPVRAIYSIGRSTILASAQAGFFFAIIRFIHITSFLSIAIASINLLPIPILDGGRFVFYTFYRIIRKTPSLRSTLTYNTIGGIIMILLLFFVMFSDIKSFF